MAKKWHARIERLPFQKMASITAVHHTSSIYMYHLSPSLWPYLPYMTYKQQSASITKSNQKNVHKSGQSSYPPPPFHTFPPPPQELMGLLRGVLTIGASLTAGLLTKILEGLVWWLGSTSRCQSQPFSRSCIYIQVFPKMGVPQNGWWK